MSDNKHMCEEMWKNWLSDGCKMFPEDVLSIAALLVEQKFISVQSLIETLESRPNYLLEGLKISVAYETQIKKKLMSSVAVADGAQEGGSFVGGFNGQGNVALKCSLSGGGGSEWKEMFRFDLKDVIVNTFSQGEFVSLQGQHLVVHQLPESFRQRYGQVPQYIFVRESYRRLYEIVSDLMLNGSMEFGATLFTGVPGIGKSLFLVYFIYRFLHDDHFPDKRFAVEFHQGVYVCFQPTADVTEFSCTRQNGSYMPSKNFLLLCDINDAVEPVSRAKWTFIFSSPGPDRYKEILKNAPSFKYTIPTWSELELIFVNDDIALWYEDFVLFGGVPRHVIPRVAGISPRTMLQEALAEKGGAIAEEFFKFSF